MHGTFRWSLALALMGLVAPAAGGEANQPVDPGNGATTLEWAAREAARMGERLPAFPESLPAWEERRAEVRRALAHDALGLPERQPMRARIAESRVEDGLRYERVHYLWADETYGSGMVVRPAEADEPLPALVQPPGWVEGWDAAQDRRDIAMHLARRGFLVFVIADPRVDVRTAPYAALYHLANAAGTPAMGIQVFDALRALDYLLTRPDVDPGRIGVSGLCQGSEQTWLAAALDDRFQVAVPVCGTTNYEHWVRMPTELGVSLSDPSPYVWRILKYTDWHEIDACIAPRPVLIVSNSGDNWWPLKGYDKAVETLEKAFTLYGAPEKFRAVRRLETHNFMPFVEEITDWHQRYLAASPPRADAPREPLAQAPESPSFSMLDWLERRIASQSAALNREFGALEEWTEARHRSLARLREVAALDRRRPAPSGKSQTSGFSTLAAPDGVTDEIIHMPVSMPDLYAPARLVRPATPSGQAVVLSHDGAANPASAVMTADALTSAAHRLALRGWTVLIPEHASNSPDSRRFAGQGAVGLSDLYGCADTIGVPPLALRIWDDLAALDYLLGREDVDPETVFAAGVGVGGIDATLAAAADQRFAGAVNVGGVTTLPEWARGVRDKHAYDQVEPYLPALASATDLDLLTAAVAPRPLVISRAEDAPRRSDAGWARTTATAASVYALHQRPDLFVALPDSAKPAAPKERREPAKTPAIRPALEILEAFVSP